jgi:hypothetical protein
MPSLFVLCHVLDLKNEEKKSFLPIRQFWEQNKTEPIKFYFLPLLSLQI